MREVEVAVLPRWSARLPGALSQGGKVSTLLALYPAPVTVEPACSEGLRPPTRNHGGQKCLRIKDVSDFRKEIRSTRHAQHDGTSQLNLGQHSTNTCIIPQQEEMNIHADTIYSLASVQVSFSLQMSYKVFAFVENSFFFP